MTSAVSITSVSIVSTRKGDLVAVGEWALAAGDSALVSAITLAIQREGLASA